MHKIRVFKTYLEKTKPQEKENQKEKIKKNKIISKTKKIPAHDDS
jgi:hypothetical protein